MPNHTTKEGECSTSLAALYGFGSYKTIYDDGGNAALKKKRPNPNLLVPGDAVVVPEKGEKTAEAPTGKATRFKVKLPKAELRVHLRDLVGKKLANAKYKLVVGAQTIEGTADGDGFLKQPIPPDAATASLEIEIPPPPAPAPPPADGLVVPKETFTIEADPKDPAKEYKPIKKLVWALTLGALRPVDDNVGVKNRLRNLGYDVVVNAVIDPAATEAIKAFQEERKLATKNGTPDAPTRAELEKVHDKGAA